ncbi:thioredoxin [Oxalicibacterium flavum]|uniref:Thioredoxin n=1 Tax=Oxalicibacterium flavum TaxID=179467 RepID=A0A8J2UNT5_9BURK|nr:TlpA disulfide reductase family protein [Oxalicibacterium flavum]GGC08282.1 thioredoxin [Oxalicibacterium flavum]
MTKKILLFAMVALVFGILGSLYSAWRYMPATPESPVVAKLLANKMPDVVNQRAQSLSAYQGKTLVLNFWATWCAPCVDEMPELVQLQKDFAERDVQVLGISIDTPDNVRAFAEKYNISYPLLLAGMTGTDLARQFGNQTGGLPFTVLVTPSGAVKKTYLGRLKMEELRADLLAI